MNTPLTAVRNPISRLPSWTLPVLLALCAGFLVAFRADYAPDLFTDEIIYTRMSMRVLGDNALVWDSGAPFMVHPPLYFLLSSIYLGFRLDPNTPIYAPGDIFTTVAAARGLNAILAALTVLVLFRLSERLAGRRLALIVALLFLLDPFGIRINRRAMLETGATFLGLLGLYFFWRTFSQTRLGPVEVRKPGSYIASGLAFGLALLTKEITFVFLLPVLVFGLLETTAGIARSLRKRRTGSRPPGGYLRLLFDNPLSAALATTGIALATYSIYPLWVTSTGVGDQLFAEKILSARRLVGLVQLTGWNRPGISLIDLLLQRLIDYGTSYILISLGGLATLFLLVLAFRSSRARFLASIGAVLYPFFAFIAVFGSGNDQFFYFLVSTSPLFVGYVLLRMAAFQYRPRNRLLALGSSLRYAAIPVLLIFMLPINLVNWLVKFGIEHDNAYAQMSAYVQANLPPGEAINASGDPIKYLYFLPGNEIYDLATPEEAMQSGVQYYAVAPKDVALRYGVITPELASWVDTNGEIVFQTTGDSYGPIRLYRMPESLLSEPYGGVQAFERPILPAAGGKVNRFTSMLLLWIIGLGLIDFTIKQVRRITQSAKGFTPDVYAALPGPQEAMFQDYERNSRGEASPRQTLEMGD